MVNASAVVLCIALVQSVWCQTEPLCSRIEKLDVIFVGELISTSIGNPVNLVVELFRITEAFKGLPKGTKEILVVTDCPGHLVGQSYLVNNQLGRTELESRSGVTGIGVSCSDARLANNALDDISLLRAWKQGKAKSQIIGQVSQFILQYGKPPLENAFVKLSGPGGEKVTVSDNHGKYNFTGLDAGNYQIHVERQGFQELKSAESNVVVPRGGCALVQSFMRSDTRIRLAVTDKSGNFVPKLAISLTIANPEGQDYQMTEHTNMEGILDVSGLPSATYLISVNENGPRAPYAPYPPTFYPGTLKKNEATLISLAPYEQRLDLKFRLPVIIPTRFISVHVVYKDGNPAVGATVFSAHSSVEHTDKDGNAVVPALEGFEETINAWLDFETTGKQWLDFKRWKAKAIIPGTTGNASTSIQFLNWVFNRDDK